MFIQKRLLFAAYTILLKICYATALHKNHCPPSSCGNIHNITYPFRLETDPKHCGDLKYTLTCERNSTVLYLFSGKYDVLAINYDNFTIRLLDAGVVVDNCSSIPRFSLTTYNFSVGDPYATRNYKRSRLSKTISFIKCANRVNTSFYVETDSCIHNEANSSSTQFKESSYVIVRGVNATDLMDFCSVELMVMCLVMDNKSMSFVDIHRQLAYGFELSWFNIFCGPCKRACYLDEDNKRRCYGKCWCYSKGWCTGTCKLDDLIRGILRDTLWRSVIYFVVYHSVTKSLCGIPGVLAFLIDKWRRRHLSGYNTIEEFLHGCNTFMPVRYSYSEIKKMTKGFNNKLGQGGFGSVYKGKLRSGNFAAIKVLSKSKSNGQDFMSEVATIGRIHHINIVQLVGFCVEGSKQALVYDYMPNGSLEKYIFSQQGSNVLSWEKLYEISIGVARGIEYLHRGCDMQILHFDIKPHNILLDENFIPKISDFGLAKLYPANGSIASLTAARGTIGYMAPELFYKNIGRVSHKSDVYSFGILLLEMAGRRKNLNALAENSSQIYFQNWMYDQVSNDNVVAIGDMVEEEEKKIAKKMVVVGLWCIQMEPKDRPPMNKVIEMLEGDLERLQLPPRPLLYPEETMRDSSSFSVDCATSSCSCAGKGKTSHLHGEEVSLHNPVCLDE